MPQANCRHRLGWRSRLLALGVDPKASLPSSSLWGPLTLQVGTGGGMDPDTSQPSQPSNHQGGKRGQEAGSSLSISHPPPPGRETPPAVLLLLNSRDSDPFLTETHECLLGPERPRAEWGLLATAQPGPPWVRRGCQSLKPTPQARTGRAEGGGPGRLRLPGPPGVGPVALAHHLWQDSSSSSANVPSLRASILTLYA